LVKIRRKGKARAFPGMNPGFSTWDAMKKDAQISR
jgi:hypothetical protein